MGESLSSLENLLSHVNFICIPAVQMNFISRLIPVTGKDELDKFVCSQPVGLHSAVGRTLQRMEIKWKSRNQIKPTLQR